MSFTSIRYVNVSHFELDIMILKERFEKGDITIYYREKGTIRGVKPTSVCSSYNTTFNSKYKVTYFC